jgi:chloramphenicol-sensitive protein RarD
MKIFNKGIVSSSLGSFWWGVLGTYYFQYISFIGTFEVVVHRCIWTTLILFITTFIFGKWNIFKKVILNIFHFPKINVVIKRINVVQIHL